MVGFSFQFGGFFFVRSALGHLISLFYFVSGLYIQFRIQDTVMCLRLGADTGAHSEISPSQCTAKGRSSLHAS
jgi:hypothetical protein